MNALWLVIEKFIVIFSGLLCTMLATRGLSVSDYSIITFCQAIFALLLVLATFSLDGVVLKYFSDKKIPHEKVLGTSLMIQSIGLVILAVTVYSLFIIQGRDTQFFVVVSIVLIPIIFRRAELIAHYFKVINKSNVIAKARLVARLSSVFYLASLYFIGTTDIYLYALYLALEAVIYAVLLILHYFKHENTDRWAVNFNLCKSMFKDAGPDIVIASFLPLSINMNVIALENYHGIELVGVYTLSILLLTSIPAIYNSFCEGVYKRLTVLKEEDFSSFLEGCKAYYFISFYSSVGFVLLVSTFSDSIFEFLFGEKYISYNQVFTYALYILPIICVSRLSFRLMYLFSLEKYNYYRALLGVSFGLIGPIFIVPHYGVEGAIFGVFLYYIMGEFLGYLLSKKTRFIVFLCLKGIVTPVSKSSLLIILKSKA